MISPALRMLLKHELRLAVRAIGLDRWAVGWSGHVGLAALVLGLLHLIAWPLAAVAPPDPPTSVVAVTWLALVVVLVLSTMLSAALNRCVEALFLRNDLDLLFSSPLSPRDVLLARTLVVAIGTPLVWLVLLYPVANMGLALQRPWLTWLYLTVPLAGVLTSALAMVLSLTLAGRIGARRTMVLSQVLGVAAGAGGYLLFQMVPRWLQQPGVADALAASWSWPLAQAAAGLATGSVLTLIATVLVSLALLSFGVYRLDRDFLRSRQELRTATRADGRPGRDASPARSTAMASTAHPLLAICLKEWRCLLRDPLLLSRLALSFVYMVPALAPLVIGRDSGWSLPASLFGIVLGTGILAQQLAQLMAHMDELPEVAYNGPRPLGQVLAAKAVAAAVPALAIGLLLLALAGLSFGASAWIGLVFMVIAVASSASVMVANTRIVPRAQFGKGGEASGIDIALINALLLMALGGSAAAAAAEYLLVGLVLAVLAGAFALHEALSLKRMRQAWTLWRATS